MHALVTGLTGKGARPYLRVSGRWLTTALVVLCTMLPATQASPQTLPEQLVADLAHGSLFTGSATLTIPIELAPGTAGYTPRVVFRYSSQSVDELGPRDQGQIAGLGWMLDAAPYIHRDTKSTSSFDDDRISLVFYGVRYELIKGPEYQGAWYYRPKDGGPLFHIWWTEFDDTWTVITKDGTEFVFGATRGSTAESTLRRAMGPIPYRYMATWVRHRGGYVWFRYLRDQATANGVEYTQAIYVTGITYTHTSIEFSSDPNNYGYYPGPSVGPEREINVVLGPRTDWTDTTGTAGTSFHTTRRLRSIEVRVGFDLVRRYELEHDYSTDRDTSYTWQGGATGDLTLRSITEYASDGVTALPPRTFDYDGRLLMTAGNGIGGTLTLAYERVTSVTPNRSRVTQRTLTDGRPGSPTMVTSYTYTGLATGPGGEFWGHATVRANGPGDRYTEVWFHQEAARLGRPFQIDVGSQASGQLFTRVLNEWAYIGDTQYPGTGFVAVTQVDAWTYDGDLTAKNVRRTHQYDAYGNVTQTWERGDHAVSGDERTIIVEWATDKGTSEGDPYQDTPYVVDRPGHRVVKDAAGVTVAEEWFYYNSFGNLSYTGRPGNGDLLRHCRWLSGTTNVCEDYEYDFTYGVLTKATDARGHATTFTYDDSLTFLRTITSPPTAGAPNGLVTTLNYDLGFGVLLNATDPNGRTTSYDYDLFGREVTRTDPLGRVVSTSYDDIGTVGQQRIAVRLPDGSGDGLWHTEYFDGLGRTFEVQRESATAGIPVVVRTDYDSRGNVARRSLPFFSSASIHWVRSAYDVLDRLTLTTLPDLRTVQRSYSDWVTTITDARGNQRVVFRDAYGRITRVVEPGAPGAETVYTHDALGRLTTVRDPVGNQTEIAYDTLGRRTRLVEPNIGAWTYEYDANGNLTRQIDAKGQLVTFEYDALNRPITKSYPDGRRRVFRYDNEPDARGRLIRAEDLDSPGATVVATEYDYDELGRIKARVDVVDGLPHTTRFGYTSFGALETFTYPDGEVLTYSYDTGGRVRRVVGTHDGSTWTYLSAVTYDAAGQPTQMRRHGNVTTDRWFSSKRLWLDRVRSYVSTTGLQDLVYEHDGSGNVTRIYNNRDRAQDQEFTYDALDRLKRAVGGYGTVTYAYDALGNLMDRGGVTYGYGATAQTCDRFMPHAVTSTGDGLTYEYDCNGNVTADGERTFTWNADDQPVAITRPGFGTTSFVYGPTGERVKKVNGTGTVRYIGTFEDHVEENTTVKHIYAAGYRIATKRTAGGGAPEVVVPLDDHLGSLHALVQGTQVLARQGYLPYGEIDPAHTSGSADWFQTRFTGQEHDPETGLYYYGARYYSPRLGRFISADPVVADLYNPQNLNRYSYVLNNPMTLADPTGLTPEVVIVCPPDCGGGGGGAGGGGGGVSDPGGGLGGNSIGEVIFDGLNAIDNFFGCNFGWGSCDHGDGPIRRQPLPGDAPVSSPPPWDGGTTTRILRATHAQPFESHWVLRMLVPGQVAWDSAVTAWQRGDLGSALAGASLMAGEQALTLTGSGGVFFAGRLAALGLVAAERGTTVLGHFPGYITEAQRIGARYFDVPTSVWAKMSPAEQWAANQRFLDRLIARGDVAVLSTPAAEAKPGSFFMRELEYLVSRGYTLSDDGMRLLPPVP